MHPIRSNTRNIVCMMYHLSRRGFFMRNRFRRRMLLRFTYHTTHSNCYVSTLNRTRETKSQKPTQQSCASTSRLNHSRNCWYKIVTNFSQPQNTKLHQDQIYHIGGVRIKTSTPGTQIGRIFIFPVALQSAPEGWKCAIVFAEACCQDSPPHVTLEPNSNNTKSQKKLE